MVSNVMKNELLNAIDALSDSQIAVLIQVAKAMQSAESRADYDPSKDTIVGFAEGPSTDLSSRAKEILREEIDPRSGWTQKDRL
jgi:hypothetical protein